MCYITNFPKHCEKSMKIPVMRSRKKGTDIATAKEKEQKETPRFTKYYTEM